MHMDEGKTKTFIEILSGECRALSERFHLSGEQSDALREFVTSTAMRSWRNGRAVGFLRAREGKDKDAVAA